MIKELGFSQYAFGGRQEHVNLMAEELMLAKATGIKISAVWLYITNKDSLLKLKSANEKVFDSLRSTGLLTQIWVGIDAKVFNGLTHVESLTKASEIIAALAKEPKIWAVKLPYTIMADGLANLKTNWKSLQNYRNTISALSTISTMGTHS
jgi:hypothetical protein